MSWIKLANTNTPPRGLSPRLSGAFQQMAGSSVPETPTPQYLVPRNPKARVEYLTQHRDPIAEYTGSDWLQETLVNSYKDYAKMQHRPGGRYGRMLDWWMRDYPEYLARDRTGEKLEWLDRYRGSVTNPDYQQERAKMHNMDYDNATGHTVIRGGSPFDFARPNDLQREFHMGLFPLIEVATNYRRGGLGSTAASAGLNWALGRAGYSAAPYDRSTDRRTHRVVPDLNSVELNDKTGPRREFDMSTRDAVAQAFVSGASDDAVSNIGTGIISHLLRSGASRLRTMGPKALGTSRFLQRTGNTLAQYAKKPIVEVLGGGLARMGNAALVQPAARGIDWLSTVAAGRTITPVQSALQAAGQRLSSLANPASIARQGPLMGSLGAATRGGLWANVIDGGMELADLSRLSDQEYSDKKIAEAEQWNQYSPAGKYLTTAFGLPGATARMMALSAKNKDYEYQRRLDATAALSRGHSQIADIRHSENPPDNLARQERIIAAKAINDYWNSARSPFIRNQHQAKYVNMTPQQRDLMVKYYMREISPEDYARQVRREADSIFGKTKPGSARVARNDFIRLMQGARP